MLASKCFEQTRTQLQFLVEVIGFLKCPTLSRVTYAFLSNSLTGNFNDYLPPELVRVTKFAPNNKYNVADEDYYQEVVVEEVDADELLESSRRIVRDLCLQVNPRESISRFSIHNPMARFSTTPEEMRATVLNYQQVGRPTCLEAPIEEEELEEIN